MITLTIEQKGKESFDIQVPSEQRIQGTLQVLIESGFVMGETILDRPIYSMRNHSYLDITKSYEENNIYTADIISIG